MSIFKNLLTGTTKPGSPIETTDATFDQDVLKSELPVLVDFWSPTCMPCHVMGGLLREVGPEYVGRVNIYKLNVAQNMQAAVAFRVRAIPTLLFIKNGKIVDQVVGLIPIDTLRQKLDKLAPAAASQNVKA